MQYAFTDTGMVFGHRGVRWEAPMNTLAGFRRARELGLAGVEFDVQLCQTGEIVVIHDFTVDGTTDGHGRVDGFAFDALRELDAGGGFRADFAGERIPTLDEVIEETGPELLLNIELKTDTVRGNGLEEAVAGIVQRCGCLERVLLSSFNPFALLRIRRLLPAAPLGLLYAPDLALYLRRAWFAPILKPAAMHPSYVMLTAAGLRFARRRAALVNTWTVNDVTEMERLLAAKVNAIITDEPVVLQAVVAGKPPPLPMEMAYKAARAAA